MAYFRKVKAKNKKGYTWAFTLELGRDPETGKRKQVTRRGFDSKKEAELVANQLSIDIENENYIKESEIYFNSFINDYLNLVAKQNVKSSTYYGYNTVVQKRLVPKFGHIKIKSLTPKMIMTYYKELLDEGLTEEYIQYLHSILLMSAKTAIDWKYVKNDFMHNVKPPRRKKKTVETWTIEECNTFLDRMKQQKDHIHMLYYLAIYTGMRRGELLGLRWGDVDFNNKRIFVKHSLYFIGGKGLVLQEPKTASGKRNVAIDENIINELKSYRLKKQQQLLQVGQKLNDDHFVVSAFGGEPVNPNTIHKQFLYDIKLAGVKRIRFHDLRHTHATVMLEIGENTKIVSERLGHANTSITLDKYSHVTPNMQDSSIENFSKAFLKSSSDK